MLSLTILLTSDIPEPAYEVLFFNTFSKSGNIDTCEKHHNFVVCLFERSVIFTFVVLGILLFLAQNQLFSRCYQIVLIKKLGKLSMRQNNYRKTYPDIKL